MLSRERCFAGYAIEVLEEMKNHILENTPIVNSEKDLTEELNKLYIEDRCLGR